MSPDHPFAQSLLDRIDERDRLVGLSQAAAITLEEHAVTKEWTLTVSPKADTPLPFQPQTHRASMIHELNRTIRATGETIANLAKDTTTASIEDAVTELIAKTPTSPLDRPSYAEWVPTDDHQRFESVRTVVCWTAVGYVITPTTNHVELVITDTGMTLVDPNGVSHAIEVTGNNSNEEAPQPIEEQEEPPIQVDISSEASMDDALRRAYEEGLRNLTPERKAELTKLKRQLQFIHFFDGFTTFSGVAAFIVGAAFIYRFAGFPGSVVFAIVVALIYRRYGQRVLFPL